MQGLQSEQGVACPLTLTTDFHKIWWKSAGSLFVRVRPEATRRFLNSDNFATYEALAEVCAVLSSVIVNIISGDSLRKFMKP